MSNLHLRCKCIQMYYMNCINLYDQWRTMNDNRLASKPISIRLPVHVLARINAISELFPSKIRTDILTDLIKTGLEVLKILYPLFITLKKLNR